MMLGCMAALCVTSCLNNDDNDNSQTGLTPAEKALCYSTLAGDYTGDLLYMAVDESERTEAVDTIDGRWYIPTDSTLIITDFPSALLAEHVSQPPLKEALADAPDQTIKCQVYYTQLTPIEFLVNPYPLTYTLNYGGGTHEVQVYFYANNAYSFGSYDPTEKKLFIKIIEGVIYVDGQQTNYLTSTPFLFVAQKK